MFTMDRSVRTSPEGGSSSNNSSSTILRAIAGSRRLPTATASENSSHNTTATLDIADPLNEAIAQRVAAAAVQLPDLDPEEDDEDDRVMTVREQKRSSAAEEGQQPAKKKVKTTSTSAAATTDTTSKVGNPSSFSQEQQEQIEACRALIKYVGQDYVAMSEKARRAIQQFPQNRNFPKRVSQQDPSMWEWIQQQTNQLQKGTIQCPYKLRILQSMNFPGAQQQLQQQYPNAPTAKQPPTASIHSPDIARQILAKTPNTYSQPRTFTTTKTQSFRENATEFITTSVSLLDRKTVSKREQKWIDKYKELQQKLQEHTHLTAPAIVQDTALQKWIDQQRNLFKDTGDEDDQIPVIPDERVRLLKLLVPHFFVAKNGSSIPAFAMGTTSLLQRTNLKPREKEWLQHYQKLQHIVTDYKEQQDSSSTTIPQPLSSSLMEVPVIQNDTAMQLWIQEQQRLWIDTGFVPPPHDERVRLLRALVPALFRPDDALYAKRNDKWMQSFHQLAEAMNRHGGVLDELALQKEHPDLGPWIRRQRAAYHSKDKPMNPERVELLNRIKFNWNPTRLEAKWMVRYQELVEYKELFGHTNVPDTKNSKWTKLANWAHAQRKAFRGKAEGQEKLKANLTEERLQLLRDLDFDFSRKQVTKDWSYRFNELVEYKRIYGDTLVPKRYTNKQLARWVTSMRKAYSNMLENKPHSLTDEKIQQLESIGFVWRVRDFRPMPARRTEQFANEDEAAEKEAQRRANRARKDAKTALFQTRELEKQAEELLAQARKKRAEYDDLDAQAKVLEKRALEISRNASQNNQGS